MAISLLVRQSLNHRRVFFDLAGLVRNEGREQLPSALMHKPHVGARDAELCAVCGRRAAPGSSMIH